MDAKPLQEVMYTRAIVQTQAVKEITGTPLWTSPQSLHTLDSLLDAHMNRHPKDPDAVAGVVGAFVGECLRKALDAAWEGDPEGEVRLVLPDGRRIDPVGRAKERITKGRAASLAVYGEAALAYARDPSLPPPETVEAPVGGLKGLFGRRGGK